MRQNVGKNGRNRTIFCFGEALTLPAPRKKIPTARLRIIAGQWRGRLLEFPEEDGLRPTGNRIRETLFNWLMPCLPGARCLDLFAGSGALGFEALSRGAASAVLVEANANVAASLRTNLQKLNCDRAKVVQASGPDYLAQSREQFDVVFLDPPFAGDLYQPALAALPARLAPGALVYIETPRAMTLDVPDGWVLHRCKQAGSVSYSLYEVSSGT